MGETGKSIEAAGLALSQEGLLAKNRVCTNYTRDSSILETMRRLAINLDCTQHSPPFAGVARIDLRLMFAHHLRASIVVKIFGNV